MLELLSRILYFLNNQIATRIRVYLRALIATERETARRSIRKIENQSSRCARETVFLIYGTNCSQREQFGSTSGGHYHADTQGNSFRPEWEKRSGDQRPRETRRETRVQLQHDGRVYFVALILILFFGNVNNPERCSPLYRYRSCISLGIIGRESAGLNGRREKPAWKIYRIGAESLASPARQYLTPLMFRLRSGDREGGREAAAGGVYADGIPYKTKNR